MDSSHPTHSVQQLSSFFNDALMMESDNSRDNINTIHNCLSFFPYTGNVDNHSGTLDRAQQHLEHYLKVALYIGHIHNNVQKMHYFYTTGSANYGQCNNYKHTVYLHTCSFCIVTSLTHAAIAYTVTFHTLVPLS